MSGNMSRNKGQRGEREIINILQPIVDEVYNLYPLVASKPPLLQRNTLQSDRGGFDIVGLDWFAPEIKFQEQLAVNNWWAQTIAQASEAQTPVLFYRQSRKKWNVVMQMFARTGNEAEEFYARAEISLDHFLIYFRHRLHAEIKSKHESIKWLPGLDIVI